MPTLPSPRLLVIASALLLASSPVGLAGLAAPPPAPDCGGCELWVARHAPGNAQAVAYSGDGNLVVVTGSSNGDIVTIAYDAVNGAQVWTATHDGGVGVDVVVSGGTVFVTGYESGPGGSLDWVTIAYGLLTGMPLWVASFNGVANANDVARAIAVAPHGGVVYVLGYSVGVGTGADFAVAAYNAAAGTPLWVGLYDGPGHGHDDPCTPSVDRTFQGCSLGVDPDGNAVYATGRQTGADGLVYMVTVAFGTTTGSVLWASAFDEKQGGGHAVTASRDVVFATGTAKGANSYNDATTIAYDAANGTQRWVRQFDSGELREDRGKAITTFGGTFVLVAGYSWKAATANDFMTLAYDGDGNLLWDARHNGGQSDEAQAVGVAAGFGGMKVVVAGWGWNGNVSPDYTTVAYDLATGALAWVALYDGPANGIDVGQALAVRPQGDRVAVTGQSRGLNSYDYATVSYSV